MGIIGLIGHRPVKPSLHAAIVRCGITFYAYPNSVSCSPLPMDIIFLRELKIDTIVGIYEWERRMPQTVIFDLEMGTDIAKAAASDNIDDTLNYKAVAKRIIGFVGDSEFQLVETLAERVAELIQTEFGVAWLKLTLNKVGAVRGSRDVGIIIERGTRT